jgi:nickel transport protein
MPRRAGVPRTAIGVALFATGLAVAPIGASAHQLVVFASVDCAAVTVEAKFSNGRVAQAGEVRVLDGNNALQTALALGTDGTAQIPLDSVDHASGLVIEVDTGNHDNYWIVTPEDIAQACGS